MQEIDTDLWSTESLKVTVHLKAVITRVSHNNMAVRGQGETLRPVKRIRRCVDVGQEGTASVKHLLKQGTTEHTCISYSSYHRRADRREHEHDQYLYATVSPISYDDVPVNVHCHARWSVELPIAFPVWAEFEQELTFSTEHL